MNKHIAGRQGDIKAIGKVNGYSLPQSCCFCRTFAKVQSSLVLFLYRMMISPLRDLTFYKVYLLAVELWGFYQ